MQTMTFNLPPLLIKIGKKEHLLRLKELGEVFFGTYEGYRKQEEVEINSIKEKINNNEEITEECFDLIKRDHLEGLEKRLHGLITIKSSNISDLLNVKDISATFNLFQNDYSHLYCMFGFAKTIDKNFKFDDRLSKFGDYALIFNSKVFLTALAQTLKKDYGFNYVSYYNQNEIKPKLGAFAKRNIFSYQYEYRIAANLIENKIYIGNVLNKENNSILIRYEDLKRMKLQIQ